jgi:hypothetical protein
MSRLDMLSVASRILFDWRFEELKIEHELLNGPTHRKHKWPMRSRHLLDVDFKNKWEGVELLTLASKAFMDTRLLELKKKNDRLKLQRFWQIYGAGQLQNQLRGYQWIIGAVHCECVSCKKYQRFKRPPHRLPDEDEEAEAEWNARYYANKTWDVCEYQPWFHDFLTVDVGEIGIQHVYFKGNHVEWFFGYGPKFLNARSVADPELRKLENIFDELYYISKLK